MAFALIIKVATISRIALLNPALVPAEEIDVSLSLASSAVVRFCGTVSSTLTISPPKNNKQILLSARPDGWPQVWPEALAQLAQWVKEGKIKDRETITPGLENAPSALWTVQRREFWEADCKDQMNGWQHTEAIPHSERRDERHSHFLRSLDGLLTKTIDSMDNFCRFKHLTGIE
jgi:hypothetical protein